MSVFRRCRILASCWASRAIDIDLDCDEAIRLAPDYLPETGAIFGRRSKRRSHYLYRVNVPPQNRRFRCPESSETILEIRSTRLQTLFPPSKHPSGEHIEWDAAGEPAEIDADTLTDAVERLAESVLRERGTHPTDLTARDTHSTEDDRLLQAVQAMLRIGTSDHNDGSYRLFAAACRTIEHDLDDNQALCAVRLYEEQRPFPRSYTDEEVLRRIQDAKSKVQRGVATGNGNLCLSVSTPPEYPDPGPLPNDLLHVPGFVGDVIEHCMATAPYPNRSMAFCGALALQAVLAGRKVCDAADVRANMYLLGLAFSGVGKDWPRKVNTHILQRVGLLNAIGEKFASGEGIQDALFATPAMLFQTDEIDGLIQSITKSRDARYEGILATLLTMYSAANSIYPMRRKAGKESPGVIDQPCLVLFGTAIPTNYYEALSPRLLTNGFFARTMIVESGPRSTGQEPGTIDPPPDIIERARWWAEFSPGNDTEYWQPRIVTADDDARALLTDARRTSDKQYSAAESRGDPVGTTVWGRVPEQIRKLALLYAISANHLTPRIGSEAMRWAVEFVLHQTHRRLAMASNNVADNPFHKMCLKVLGKLRDAPNGELPHSLLLKRMKVNTKTFQEIILTLVQWGDVAIDIRHTGGRPVQIYRLAERRDKMVTTHINK